jgi:hypothetical protein
VLETQKSNGIADMGSVKPELGESQTINVPVLEFYNNLWGIGTEYEYIE